MAIDPRYAQKTGLDTAHRSPLYVHVPVPCNPCSRHEQRHQTDPPNNSHPIPPPISSSSSLRPVVLRDRGGPRRATLHHDPRSRTARPARVPAGTAPAAAAALATRAGEPSLRTSTARCCRRCAAAVGHGDRDAVAVDRERRGGDGAGRQAAVPADLAAAAVVVGAALVVARWALRGRDGDGGGGGRCGGGDGGGGWTDGDGGGAGGLGCGRGRR